MAITPRIVGTTGGIDSDGHLSLDIVYEVQVTTDITSTTDAWTVLQAVYAVAPATYTVGSSTASNAFAQKMGPANLREAGDRQIWTCPVSYSTKPVGMTNSGGGGVTTLADIYTTPIAEPWKISGTYLRGDALTITDKDGNFITTLGTEEIKAIQIPSGYDTLHMEGYTATIDLQTRAQCIFHCNSVPMWGLIERQLLLVSWQYDIRRYAGGQCVYHSLDWEIKYAKWNDSFRNVSFKKINPDYNPAVDPRSKRLVTVFGKDDLPITEPEPIDADGNPCELAAAPVVTVKAVPEFNFLAIGFPVTLPGPFV